MIDIGGVRELNWWELIEKNPHDSLTWMAFADWLEEQNHPDEAFAVRWLSKHSRRPRLDHSNRLFRQTYRTSYDWWNKDHHPPPTFAMKNCLLPGFVYRFLAPPDQATENWAEDPKGSSSYREYPSFESACKAAVAAAAKASRYPAMLPLFDAFDLSSSGAENA